MHDAPLSVHARKAKRGRVSGAERRRILVPSTSSTFEYDKAWQAFWLVPEEGPVGQASRSTLAGTGHEAACNLSHCFIICGTIAGGIAEMIKAGFDAIDEPRVLRFYVPNNRKRMCSAAISRCRAWTALSDGRLSVSNMVLAPAAKLSASERSEAPSGSPS
jgi:hypothetical protein